MQSKRRNRKFSRALIKCFDITEDSVVKYTMQHIHPQNLVKNQLTVYTKAGNIKSKRRKRLRL